MSDPKEWRRDARILIVDDQPTIVMLMTRMLESAGFSSISATTDPSSLVERCEQEAPDLLVIDLVMPPFDGVELLERLRPAERQPPLAVLVVSGESRDSPHADRARAAGAADVLEKPFGRAELVAAVRGALA